MIEKKYLTEAMNYRWIKDIKPNHYVDAKLENGQWKLAIIDSISGESFSAQIRYDGWEVTQVILITYLLECINQ